MERVTAAIMAAGTKYSAADVFQAYARLSQLQAQARLQLAKVQTSPAWIVIELLLVSEAALLASVVDRSSEEYHALEWLRLNSGVWFRSH